MQRGFWKQYIAERQFELAYTAGGVVLGAAIWVFALVLDSYVRRLAGEDPAFLATFLSTSVHTLNLALPVLLGQIARYIGRHRRGLDNALRMAKETEILARERASRDTVTGLFNRTHLLSVMEEGIATREWSSRNALLLLLDLDGFKTINDTYGHHAGDEVLETVAHRIAAVCGEHDIAVRLGGDEFVVVHFHGSDPQRAGCAFAARLLDAIAAEITIRDVRIRPNTSVGIARVGQDGKTCSEVLKAADLALYQAKTEVGGAFRFFDPAMHRERDRLQRLEAELRLGIERGEFFVQYQPIYGTASGTIRSFEALVRWRHPERGLVSPADFIPLAESTGLILKLGRYILEEACRVAATWPKPVGVSVNLSPVQFKDPDLLANVLETLRRSGLAPGRLDLEVTESLLLEATPHVQAVIRHLKQAGIRITIDDFGTGYSSLSTLRNFRFDRLKIDRSFTRDLASDHDHAEIVRTIVRLSRSMRMETVLEGVETGDQLEFARLEGLTEVQGFFYSKPLSAEDAATLFARPDADEAAVA